MKRFVLASCGLVVLCGCGAAAPPTSPSATAAPVKAAAGGEPAAPAQGFKSEATAAEQALADVVATPATPAEAAAILDLRKFPRMDGGKLDGRATIARLSYGVKGKVKAVFAHHQQHLLKQRWKELPNAYVTDESASSTFARAGYHLSLSAFPSGEEVAVMLSNHGNVNLQKLPTPPGVKPLYSGPLGTAYVTEAAVDETATAVRKLLADQGWTPYGDAGDSAFYRQNAMKVSARVLSAPGQDGKTVIDYSSELLSAELPAPEDAIGLQYSEPPIQLFYDTPKSMKEVYDFYKEALSKEGWEVTTSAPVKQDFRYFFIFRNKAMDLIEPTISEFEGKTRVRVKYQTTEEVAEEERRYQEALAKKKAEKEKPPAPKEKLAIALPEGAMDIEATTAEIKFTTAPGKAKATIEPLRKQLVAAGFKEELATLEAMFGTVVLKQRDQSITLTYIDTGVIAPEVTITSFGTELEVKK